MLKLNIDYNSTKNISIYNNIFNIIIYISKFQYRGVINKEARSIII